MEFPFDVTINLRLAFHSRQTVIFRLEGNYPPRYIRRARRYAIPCYYSGTREPICSTALYRGIHSVLVIALLVSIHARTFIACGGARPEECRAIRTEVDYTGTRLTNLTNQQRENNRVSARHRKAAAIRGNPLASIDRAF